MRHVNSQSGKVIQSPDNAGYAATLPLCYSTLFQYQKEL